MTKKIRITESQLNKIVKEQSVGGFVGPGPDNVYKKEKQGPDFGNFLMYGKQLLDSGKTIGDLINKLSELPKPEPKGRIPNNDYELPQTASGGEPNLPG